MDRLPFQATLAAAPYERMAGLPVSILLHNVRSLYNVGAFFRTADAAGVDRLYLGGITGHPPQRALAKTALGAQHSVPWEHHGDPAAILGRDQRVVFRRHALVERGDRRDPHR